MNKYHKQAQDFLKKHKIIFHATRTSNVFRWGSERPTWKITLERKKGKESIEWSFPFTGAALVAKKPSICAYDVLACISGDHHYDSRKAIINAFGYEGLRDINVEEVISFAKEMKKFFTKKQLEDLQEIQ